MSCWCKHDEASHTGRGCVACQSARAVLDWRHVFSDPSESRPMRLPVVPPRLVRMDPVTGPILQEDVDDHYGGVVPAGRWAV